MASSIEEGHQDTGRVGGALAALVVCGCLIALITFGVRSIFGLFTDPVSETYGWSRDVFALSIALQNLFWGLGQPFAGALVDTFGARRVLAVGGIVYAAGLAAMALVDTPLGMHLTAGVLVGLGMGGASYITVVGALGRLVPESHRAWALGLATASGSLGQFLFAPLGQGLIGAFDWPLTVMLLAGSLMLVPFLALAVRGSTSDGPPPAAKAEDVRIGSALAQACGHGSYLLLVLGFFVCGFQLAFITVHMPPYLTDRGASPELAAWALGAIGLFNVIGAYGAGILCGRRIPKRTLLAGIYVARALIVVLFVSLPLSTASVLLFGAMMGLLWLSTVPPTSSLVALMFGTRYMATLFGIVFLSHQLGSFAGVYLGGLVYAQTGSYGPVWWLTVVLGIAAALIHLPISERPAAERLATAE